jgi:hypothetical protein
MSKLLFFFKIKHEMAFQNLSFFLSGNLRSLEVYMIINFRARGISRGARKLA